MNTKNTLPEIQKGLEEIQEELKKFEGKNIPLTVLKKVSETFFYVLSTDITEETRNDIRKLQGKIQEEIQKKEKRKEKEKDIDIDREYFEKHAEEDYKAVFTIYGRVNTALGEKVFQSQTGKIKVNAYLYRLKNVFKLKNPGEAVKKWKELAGREVQKPMDREYFEQHAREDYETAEKIIIRKINCSKEILKQKFQSQNGEITVLAYLRRLKNMFFLETEGEALNKWKELAEREVQEKAGEMNRGYFEKHAKDDYESVEKTIGVVNTSNEILKQKFQSQNGEITVLAYLRRLKNVFSLGKVGTVGEAVKKWKELAKREVQEKAGEMNREYFEKHAKKDYETVLTIYKEDNVFQSQNGEIKVRAYLYRLKKVFNLKSPGEALNKWKELAEREIQKPMDKEYFEKHAKDDYESVEKTIGAVNTSNEILKQKFQSQNGEITVNAYLYRLKKVFNLKRPGEAVKKWKELAAKDIESVHTQNLESLFERLDPEIIALLLEDPQKMIYYAKYVLKIEASEAEKLVFAQFTSLYSRTKSRILRKIEEEYQEDFENIFLEEYEESTDKKALVLKGEAEGKYVCIAGDYNRRVEVKNGRFEFPLLLKSGKEHSFEIVSYDNDTQKRSPVHSFEIIQTSSQEDLGALIRLIKDIIDKKLEENEKKFWLQIIKDLIEKDFIKYFSRSFTEGLNKVSEVLQRKEMTPEVDDILMNLLVDFEKINNLKIPGMNPEKNLLFFQKYCLKKIMEKKQEGKSGVIISNEPGLGKTIVALSAVIEGESLIICPNAVATHWAEEISNFFPQEQEVVLLQNLNARERKKILKERKGKHIITNIEFLRNIEDEERFALLSAREGQNIIIDEGHSMANESKQTQGIKMLNGAFKIIPSATPYRDPKTMCSLFSYLYPKDISFQNVKAFEKAFPKNDPQALEKLYLLQRETVVRFRKNDVAETYDENLPLCEQKERLPEKVYEEKSFEISEAQANSIYKMLLNFTEWSKEYDTYFPKDLVSQLDALRPSGDALSKLHCLRQTINHPEYTGNNEIGAKKEAVIQEVKNQIQSGRKGVIFCQYYKQAIEYKKLLAEYNPCFYSSHDETGKKCTYYKEEGKEVLFLINEKGNYIFDEKKLPIKAKKGEKGAKMLNLDYQRYRFQGDDDAQVLITTYSQGSVGVTFTAGKFMIFDDLANTYVDQYQTEDRIHRIDQVHNTHYDVRYISFLSKYPQSFLERMKSVYVEKKEDGNYRECFDQKEAKKKNLKTAYETFFINGTYDEIHNFNLGVQKDTFHIINDGVVDASFEEKETVHNVFM
jgi:hypothetical protein